MKNFLLTIMGLAFILGCIYLFINNPAPSQYQVRNLPETTSSTTPILKIGDDIFLVEIADTPEKRTLGLSGRESLEEGTGLLFIFDQPAKYGFWMKDMRFPIDIIWIGEDWRVVSVDHDIKPETYPATFTPKQPAKYVLEVPAGTLEQKDIDIGQEVYLIR